jgi:transposase InsO family protein
LDLGSEFTANVFKTVCQRLGINHPFSSVMHPTSNGQVERTNRTLLAYIRKFITANTESEDLLPTLRFSFNSARHEQHVIPHFKLLLVANPDYPLQQLILHKHTARIQRISI